MRKLATTFAIPALLLFAPVSSASANPSLCAMQFDADFAGCYGNESCQDRATRKYMDCMDRCEVTNE